VAVGDRLSSIRIAGETIEGDEVTLNEESTATVINVWASWCAPCRAEAEVLNEVAAETAIKGVNFLGVNVRDSRAAAEAFQRRFEVEYPSIFDPTSETLLVFGNTLPPNAIPSTIVLDSRNRVAARVLGGVTAPTLRAVIDEVLGLNSVSTP
jgi:thiol-disulfide isomerase/thioredoxin